MGGGISDDMLKSLQGVIDKVTDQVPSSEDVLKELIDFFLQGYQYEPALAPVFKRFLGRGDDVASEPAHSRVVSVINTLAPKYSKIATALGITHNRKRSNTTAAPVSSTPANSESTPAKKKQRLSEVATPQKQIFVTQEVE